MLTHRFLIKIALLLISIIAATPAEAQLDTLHNVPSIEIFMENVEALRLPHPTPVTSDKKQADEKQKSSSSILAAPLPPIEPAEIHSKIRVATTPQPITMLPSTAAHTPAPVAPIATATPAVVDKKPSSDKKQADEKQKSSSSILAASLPPIEPAKAHSTLRAASTPQSTAILPSTAAHTPAPAVPVVTPTPAVVDKKPSGYIEAGKTYASLHGLSNNWNGQYIKGGVKTDSKNNWEYQLANDSRFGENGTYFSISNAHNWRDDTYSIVSVGTSEAGYLFLPRYRADAVLYTKLLDKKNLVTYVGIGGAQSKSVYSEGTLSFGAIYYFNTPFIAQVGARFNDSHPGNVISSNGTAALTYGQNLHYYVAIKYSFGNEAYQILPNQPAIVNFNSSDVALDIRDWIGASWGIHMQVEYYSNPYYQRKGTLLGVFKDF